MRHDGVWIPLMFLFFYNFCFIANPAWNNFLFLGLNFTNFGYGMLAFAGALLSVAGLWAYEKFFFRSSWRQLYLWVTFVVVVFSFLQVLLVLKKTGIFSPCIRLRHGRHGRRRVRAERRVHADVHHVLPDDPGRRRGHGLRLAVDVAERRDGGRLPTGHVLDVRDRCF